MLVTIYDELSIIFPQLSVDSRVEMTKKAIKSMKHSAEKAGKRASEGDLTEGAVHRQITYEDVLNHLQQSLAHLETLSHSFISYLKTSDQVGEKDLAETNQDYVSYAVESLCTSFLQIHFPIRLHLGLFHSVKHTIKVARFNFTLK